jgi:tRNA-uridine 2-sulfurtransferase
MTKNKKIAVAMSGGVDSSFTAYKLLQEGFDVIGINMLLTDNSFQNSRTADDVQKVCDFLGIKLYRFDFRKEFKDKIIKYFVDDYGIGKTPNPCIMCNKFIKFGLLLDKAKELEANFLATGHYADIEFDNNKDKFFIKKAKDLSKDQSYFLALLTQEQMKFIKFPLTNLAKKEIREIAKDIKLPVYEKKDSQEICFIPNNEYRDCLVNFGCSKGLESGNIILEDGKIVGKHNGIANFTVGQRKGIGGHSQRMYVKKIDSLTNTVIISKDEELFEKECILKDIYFVEDKDLCLHAKNLKARIRYRHTEQNARIIEENDYYKVIFEESQRAITEGQLMVFYIEDRVVASGWI